MLDKVVIPIVFLITAFTALGDYHLKKSTYGPKFDLVAFIIGLVIYSSLAFVWAYTYKHVKFSLTGAIYGASTGLFFALIGIFVFKEQLGLQEYLGVGLAITSILLLSKFV